VVNRGIDEPYATAGKPVARKTNPPYLSVTETFRKILLRLSSRWKGKVCMERSGTDIGKTGRRGGQNLKQTKGIKDNRETMEEVCFSDKLANIYQTNWRHVSQGQ
jgi:predicted DNA-binding ArsR family transcriptional regulator